MKKHPAVALLLCASTLLSGCSSMLQRDVVSVTLHSAAPVVESDQLTIRVESYQDLVNALLYFITQGRENGTIRLYNYPYDVEKDVEDACLEVATEDPLGAYAVEDIQFDVTPIVSCYEASFQISYRRTHEQVSGIVSATGATAIRNTLMSALKDFQREVVLRVSYFDQDEQYILDLIREAYFSTPETALAYPEAEVYFYPGTGRQHIVEILLDYEGLDPLTLSFQKDALAQRTKLLTGQLWDAEGDEGLLAIGQASLDTASYDPEGGSSAYDALVLRQADSLGLALTMRLLCQQLEFTCTVVQGTLDGIPHYWTVVSTQDGPRHLDLTQTPEEDEAAPFRSDRYMAEHGYVWDTASVPQCGEQPLPPEIQE